MKRTMKYCSLLLTVALMPACDKDKKDDPQDDTTTAPTDDGTGHSDDPTNTSSTTTTTSSTTTPTDTTQPTDTTTEGPVDCGVPCDILGQNCPSGQHCVPYVCDMQQQAWDSTICVPEGQKTAGETCINPWEGDNLAEQCAHGLMCWNGLCKDQCTGTVDDPMCPGEAACLLANEGALAVCMDKCDPFNPVCGETEVCIPLGDMANAHTMACIGRGWDGMTPGVHGDPCMYLNECSPGHYCAIEWGPGSVDFPGCETSEGCCTVYCKLDGGDDQCPGEKESCVPLLIEPEPGSENIGFCIISSE